MNRTTFLNARIFDGVQSEYLDETVVVVEGDRIVAVDRTPSASISGDVVDVAGKTLMPGLIDAHCHVLGASLKVTDVETQPLTYVAGYASKMLGHALDCGFTTVRDVGGGCRYRESRRGGTDQGTSSVLRGARPIHDGRTR